MPDYTAGKARILLEPTARGFFAKAKTSLRSEFGGKKLEADVLLKPTTTRFRQDADAQLRTLRGIEYKVNLRPNISNRNLFRADAKAQAETHLKGLSAPMTIRGEMSFKYADAQLAAWRRREEAKPLKIKVITEHVGGVGRPAGGTIRDFSRPSPLQPSQTFAFGHTVPILKPQVDQAEAVRGMKKVKDEVEKPGRQPKLRPKVDDNSLKAELKKLELAFRPKRLPGPSIRGVELLAPALLSVASEAAPALVQALGEVVGSINEMAGAALAAPGALAVLGTSIGTLALGVTGMKAAWKALTQESDRAANQSTSDALTQERNQNTLKHALYDVQKAQEDLTKARKEAKRELEDLHAEERSSYLSVAEAALDLQKARNELAKPSEGPLDYNEKVLAELKAREALSAAIRRQGRAREDTAEADRKGIANSDKVRSAQEALVQSNEQVAMTLKQIATEGSGAANAADKVKAAMADLSPNAAELVQTLFDLKDKALKPLAQATSQNLFAGMSASIKELVNADLPILTTGFGRVASAMNRQFLALGKSLNADQNPRFRGVLERIFGNTEEFNKRLTKAIDPAVRALGTLAAAGSNAMPKLATQFANLTDRFANFIDKADKEGRLDQWINRGIDGLESFGRSIGNILRAIHGFGEAFGGSLTGKLETATKKMADFFNSARGQNDLIRIASLVRREWEQWRPILQDLPHLVEAAMAGIRGSMGTVLPVINVITSFFRAFPGLSTAAASAFITWRAFVPILTLVSTALGGVRRGLEVIPGVAARTKGSVGKDMQEIAALTVGVGTAANRAEREGSSAMGRFGSAIKGRATGAVAGLSKALGSAATFLSGPWGVAITIGISFLQQLIQANHDAAEAAEENRAAQERLAGSLDDVTNAAGAATRAQLSKEIQKYEPEHGLKSKPGEAAETLGIGQDRLLKAVLPGGEQDATAIRASLRDEAKGSIINAVPEATLLALKADGVSEDDIIDAYLGDQTKVEKIRKFTSGARGKVLTALSGHEFSLSDIDTSLQKEGGRPLAAAQVSQFLAARQGKVGAAQQEANAAQTLAAGGKPILTADGATLFGPGAQPHWDGSVAKVEVPGDFEHDPRTAEQAKQMSARGDTFKYDAFRNVTTVTIGTDDMAQLVKTPAPGRPVIGPPSRSAGGPSPTVGMPGPTGGIISELHPGEWVLPKEARHRLTDEWLWQQTGNKAMARNHSYEPGGPIPFLPLAPPPSPLPLAPPTPTPSPGPGTGPGPGRGNTAGAVGPIGDVPADPNTHGAAGGAPPGPPGINVGRTPDNATGPERAALNAPGPTVDANGNITSPQAKLPDFGSSLANAFLAPWGFKIDPTTGQAVSSQPAAANTTQPGAYLGQWAGGFGVALGETLLNGVAGFFGFNIDNPYFQAFKQTIGFYSGKLGQQADQYVDPNIQSVVGGGVAGYQTIVGADGNTYLVPTDDTSSDAAPLGDVSNLPVGKAPEKGLQPNAIKAERAISAAFPEIQTIGGVRDDPLKWHPEGLALDIMMPGAGGLNDPTPPKAKALGDRIWSWMQVHAQELGIDMGASIWQQKDHFNHIHLAVYGKDNPAPKGFGAGAGDTDDAGSGPSIRDQGAGGDAATDKPGPLVIPRPQAAAGGSDGGPAFFGGGAGAAAGAGHPGSPFAGRGGFGGRIGASGSAGAGGWLNQALLGGGGLGASPEEVAAANQSLMGGRGRVVVLPSNFRGRRGSGQGKAPVGEPEHSRGAIARYIYKAARAKGFSKHDAVAIVAYAQGESSLDPGISGGSQPAGGGVGTGAGGGADIVIGLFQEKPGFARAGGIDPEARSTVVGNVTAYLNQLQRHPGDNIYQRLLATSVGGPMSTGGEGAVHSLERQVLPLLQGITYDVDQQAGLINQGMTLVQHNKQDPDVVISHAMAARAVKALNAVQPQPSAPDYDLGKTARRMAPPAPPEVNIPAALPPPEPQARQMVPQPTQGPAAAGQAKPPGTQAESYEHPGLKTAVTSGATTLGNIAATAAAALGGGVGGAAGPLIAGLFQQGGKIVNDAINVGSAFASGFLHFGGTTANPYGITQTRKDSPPPLGQDNRRIHQGDNYFASMDEWRRQNQVQDAQDMQAGLARVK